MATPKEATEDTKPLFSIVVPVYNGERFLREALDSVLAQSVANWEVLGIDDGSQDCSGEIFEEYVRRDSRFRVIHQRNARLSAARNRALPYVRGAYFTFLDSDDAWAPSYLSETSKYTADAHALPDLIFHGLAFVPEIFDWRTQPFQNTHEVVRVSGAQECLVHIWGSKRYIFSSVNDKLWRTEVFRKKRFHTGIRMGEDTAFVWAESPAITSLVETGYYGYLYRTNPASMIHKPHLCASIHGWYSRVQIVLNIAKSLRSREEWATPIFGFSAFFWQWLKHMAPSKSPKTPLTFQMPQIYLNYLRTHRQGFAYRVQLLFRLLALYSLRNTLFVGYCLLKGCGVRR